MRVEFYRVREGEWMEMCSGVFDGTRKVGERGDCGLSKGVDEESVGTVGSI